jgi:hypothetical protein
MSAVWFDPNQADHRKRSAIESLDEPADEAAS